MLLGNEHKIIDFALQQWLHKHTTMVRYIYIACLVPYLGPVLCRTKVNFVCLGINVLSLEQIKIYNAGSNIN
jgi:hypothetical protein